MTSIDVTHLTQAIMELKGQIERMAERQDEMLDDVKQIKEAVYNPDEGLYARLRALEQWKENTSKVQWLVSSSVVILMVKMFWDAMVQGGSL